MENFKNYIKINKYKIIIFFVLILSLIVSMIKIYPPESVCGKYSTKSILIGQNELSVQIADNNCKKALGLSGRKNMSFDEGMFFEFETMSVHGFWMKDMNFSIDIIWLDQDFKVVGLEKSLSPSTFPKVYGTAFDSKYVLEVVAGFAEKNNIQVGNIISIVKK